jgi:hypothetical protein
LHDNSEPFFSAEIVSLYLKFDLCEICALLGYYAVLSGNSVTTFQDNISVPSSRVKKSEKKAFFSDFSSQKRADFIYIAAEA